MYIALLIPLLGTILGSAFVFFMKEKCPIMFKSHCLVLLRV